MPEGDTIAHAAERLRTELRGSTVTVLRGTHRALAANARRIAGTAVDDVEAVGKHVLISFGNGWTLRTHLGMTGVWHVYGPDEPWRKTPGKARVVLETPEAVAVCFAAPTVELAPRETVLGSIAHLGPDLMDDQVDWDAVVAAARRSDAATAADLLLDQRAMAGVGNVLKSETLFLEGIAPQTPAKALDADAIGRLARRARRLLRANRSTPRRSTTGSRRPGAAYWVYGRDRRPCRRCGTAIRSERHGVLDRITYWCPGCQLPPERGT